MNRYVCIHGHFYQPPRENPWLETIELQDSASPYHDWNERITTECYAPNAASRILDDKRKIRDIVNNYPKMSFNFGPTLLAWMENFAPEVYQAILASDLQSQKRFSGHGSALAQAYNHMILPLANQRDKKTQVIWGIEDFEYRFKRKPEGMWLPETAVDVETLEIMADHGIKFTILSPRQARRYRKIGDKNWKDAREGKIDSRRPYRFQLPSGQTMVLFFYDSFISQDVAFSGLLNSGENLANRLTGAFSTVSEEPQIVHVATDGESYGHHHRYGDMALAYCFFHLESNRSPRLTVYGEFLEKFPPEFEVKIFENSSWSCVHGVERWRNNCGCNSGLHLGWKQEWRKPLRQALDWLRDALIPIYEKEMSDFVLDPWQARDEYVKVILNRTKETTEQFLGQNTRKKLSPEDQMKVIKLLEMQRYAMLMYTSCGWFFDEISGIETIQILQYAARSIQLAREINGIDLEPHFIDRLKPAPSNFSEYGDGAWIYETFVKPTVVDLLRAGIHYAVSSVFEEYPETTRIYSFTYRSENYVNHIHEKRKLAVGKIQVRSEITGEEGVFGYAVFHLGGHQLSGGIRPFQSKDNYSKMEQDIKNAFVKEDLDALTQLIQQHFWTYDCSLWHLFKEEQEKVLNQILDSTLQELKVFFRHIFEHHYPLLRAKQHIRISLPQALSSTVEFIMNRELRELLENEEPDLGRLQELVNEVKQWSFELDNASLSFVASQRINKLMQKLWGNPDDIRLLGFIENIFKILSALQLQLDLWKAQNIYFLLGKKLTELTDNTKAQHQDSQTQKWMKSFKTLGSYLEVKGKG